MAVSLESNLPAFYLRANYFQDEAKYSKAAAERIVPILLQLFKPASVVDVGCGVGNWLKAFAKCGATDILGLDFHVDEAMLEIPSQDFIRMDLGKAFSVDRRFELALCLEVAEHLPQNSAKVLVDSLVSLAPVIVFSAAIPYSEPVRGGDLNEQWPDWWAELFFERGYVVADCLRSRLWLRRGIPYWYPQNMLVFVSKRDLSKVNGINYFGGTNAELSLVHPRALLAWTSIILRERMFRKMFRTWLGLSLVSLLYTLSLSRQKKGAGLQTRIFRVLR